MSHLFCYAFQAPVKNFWIACYILNKLCLPTAIMTHSSACPAIPNSLLIVLAQIEVTLQWHFPRLEWSSFGAATMSITCSWFASPVTFLPRCLLQVFLCPPDYLLSCLGSIWFVFLGTQSGICRIYYVSVCLHFGPVTYLKAWRHLVWKWGKSSSYHR